MTAADLTVDAERGVFGAQPTDLPGAGLPWLDRLRASGRHAFAEAGWPTRKTEAWKYTDVRALRETAFLPASSVGESGSLDRAPALLGADATAARLVFVDGQFRPELSRANDLPDGATADDLKTALDREPERLEADLGGIADPTGRPLLALNAAHMDGGAVLRVGRGVTVERPVEIVYVGGIVDARIAAHPRILIVLEDGSRLDVVEHSVAIGDGGYFLNAATEARVGNGARLRHYRVQADSAEAFAVTTLSAELGRDAAYEGFGLTTGARLSRFDAEIRMVEPGAACVLSGAYLLRGSRHTDNTTVIEHAAPHTACREVFKGVLDDRSRGVFQGRIIVRPHAQKTDGHQVSRALLLSDGAEIDAKPELEIYADDVKCSHGATAGQIDPLALFYLRARGIDTETARRLLVEAFLNDAFEEVSHPEVADVMRGLVGDWMAARKRGGT